MIGRFQDKDSDVWIWISFGLSGSGLGLLGFGFGFFRQDIGVDRDTKMVKCSALLFVFRAPVVFLRRLVLLTGCLDFDFSKDMDC